MEYLILTANATESHRLQNERWIPSANLIPVSLLGRGILTGGGVDADLFYTDAALDALVRSAAVNGITWQEWRVARGRFATVRPFDAWEYLHEASLEELEDRERLNLAIITSVVRLRAAAPTLSYLDLVNLERRHMAAAVRAAAADRLVRIAPGRVVVTEEQDGEEVTVRATWRALPAAGRKIPDWLINGLDNQSMAGVL